MKFVHKITKHILCSVTFFLFRKSCLLWDNEENIVQPDRPHMTIQRIRFERWIAKATKRTHTHTHTHTHRYVILIAIPLQQLLQKLALMLHYRHRTLSVLFGFRSRSPTSST